MNLQLSESTCAHALLGIGYMMTNLDQNSKVYNEWLKAFQEIQNAMNESIRQPQVWEHRVNVDSNSDTIVMPALDFDRGKASV